MFRGQGGRVDVAVGQRWGHHGPESRLRPAAVLLSPEPRPQAPGLQSCRGPRARLGPPLPWFPHEWHGELPPGLSKESTRSAPRAWHTLCPRGPARTKGHPTTASVHHSPRQGLPGPRSSWSLCGGEDASQGDLQEGPWDCLWGVRSPQAQRQLCCQSAQTGWAVGIYTGASAHPGAGGWEGAGNRVLGHPVKLFLTVHPPHLLSFALRMTKSPQDPAQPCSCWNWPQGLGTCFSFFLGSLPLPYSLPSDSTHLPPSQGAFLSPLQGGISSTLSGPGVSFMVVIMVGGPNLCWGATPVLGPTLVLGGHTCAGGPHL